MTAFIDAAGWTLVHFLWQGAAIAAVAAAGLRLLRHGSPQARYALGCVALAAMLASPARHGVAPVVAARRPQWHRSSGPCSCACCRRAHTRVRCCGSSASVAGRWRRARRRQGPVTRRRAGGALVDAGAGDGVARGRVPAVRAARRRVVAGPGSAPRRARAPALVVAGHVRSPRAQARAAPRGAGRGCQLRGRPGRHRLAAPRGAAPDRRRRGADAVAGGSDSRPRARARAAARRRRQRVSDRGGNVAVLSPGGVVAVVAHPRRARALLRRHRARR